MMMMHTSTSSAAAALSLLSLSAMLPALAHPTESHNSLKAKRDRVSDAEATYNDKCKVKLEEAMDSVYDKAVSIAQRRGKTPPERDSEEFKYSAQRDSAYQSAYQECAAAEIQLINAKEEAASATQAQTTTTDAAAATSTTETSTPTTGTSVSSSSSSSSFSTTTTSVSQTVQTSASTSSSTASPSPSNNSASRRVGGAMGTVGGLVCFAAVLTNTLLD